ncbi:MAG: hypothetical protein KBS63_02750 [Clostridiales bacterium]|nr:hypothetical protein [Candidatus Crickella caballi]
MNSAAQIINMLHPGLVMIVFGILVALLPAKCRVPLSLLGPAISIYLTLNMSADCALDYRINDYITIHFMHYDKLTFLFMIVFSVIAMCKAIYCINTQEKKEASMAMVYAGSMMGVVLAGDCLSLIVFWELSAVASAYIVYAGHYRRSYRAAFRYLLVHAFGGNMFLAGMIVYIFHYGNVLTNITDQAGTPMYWILFIGVAVNAAVPPLNSWVSDAYPEASVTGTPYLASFTTKAAIYVMIRFFAGSEFLIWVGVFMAIYAACMAIMENGIRRLLSYHIVSQLGMMVAAIGAGGEMGVDGAAAHAITNIFYKGALIMAVGAIMYATGKTLITELGGLGKRMPVISVCFLISSLAIAGLPGLSGFVSKALIMDALAEGGYQAASILITVAGVGTLLSITLKMNYFIFWGPCDEEAKKLEINKVPWTMQLAVVLATIASVLIGVFPQQFYALLPYAAEVNPYALGHVLEYIAIFIGGTIPFVIFIKRMRPHEDLTLDFDWFYRKGLCRLVMGIAKVTEKLFKWCEGKLVGFARYLGIHFSNPYLWTENSKSVRIRKMSFESEDQLIGDTISMVVFALTLILVCGIALII